MTKTSYFVHVFDIANVAILARALFREIPEVLPKRDLTSVNTYYANKQNLTRSIP